MFTAEAEGPNFLNSSEDATAWQIIAHSGIMSVRPRTDVHRCAAARSMLRRPTYQLITSLANSVQLDTSARKMVMSLLQSKPFL